MPIRHSALFCIISLLCIFSCTSRKPHPRLTRIEARLDSIPEEMWDSLQRPELIQDLHSRAERMHYALLRAEAMNKTMRDMDTLRFDEPYEYFMKHGNNREKMRVLYIKGCIFRDAGDAPMALQYYLDAVHSVDTTANDCDIQTLSRIYGQTAMLYHQQSHPRKEIECWRKAARYADLAHDTISSIQFRQYMGKAYYMLGRRDSMNYCFAKALEEFKRLGLRPYIVTAQSYLINEYLEQHQPEKARQLIDEYIAESGVFDSAGHISPYNASFLSTLGNYYLAVGQTDSAIHCFRERLSYSRDISNRENASRGLLEAYTRLHQPDSMAKYALIFAQANDSASLLHSAEEIARMEATYNYSENQRIAIQKSEEANRLAKSLIWQTICFISILILISYAVARFRRRAREKHAALEAEKIQAKTECNSLSEKLQHTRNDLEQFRNETEVFIRKKEETLLKERMAFEDRYRKARTEYEQVQNALKAALNDKDAFIADKEAEIEQLKIQLRKSQDRLRRFNNGKANLQNEEIVKKLHRNGNELLPMSAVEWQELLSTIERLSPDFYDHITTSTAKLSHPEIVMVVLTHCRFSLHEIRILMDISPQRITNIRSNVNKKLFNEQGSKNFTKNVLQMSYPQKV